MARHKNPLSKTQQDEPVFTAIRDKILAFTPDRLAEYGLASRQTFYKYARKEPVNPVMEKNIFESLKMANASKNAEADIQHQMAKELALA